MPAAGLDDHGVHVFLASILYAVLTARALYDDGSYYFMRVLAAGGFTEMLFTRGHAAFLFQLPVVIALKCGVRDLTQLQFAFGLGCFCAWPVALALCRWLAPKHFWMVALACGAGYLNAAFVAVGEHVVAHAFFWPVVFVLLFVRPLTPGAAVVLLLSSVILVRSYNHAVPRPAAGVAGVAAGVVVGKIVATGGLAAGVVSAARVHGDGHDPDAASLA